MDIQLSAPVSVGSAQYNVQVERMRSLLTPNRDPSSGLPPSTLYLIGDSHAESISVGMGLALRGRYQLRWASQPSEGFICARRPTCQAGECYQYFEYLKVLLNSTMRSGDVLAIMCRMNRWKNSVAQLEQVERELLEAVVLPRGGQLLILTDWHARNSFATLATTGQLREAEATEDDARAAIRPLQNRYPTVVRHVSLLPLFCEGNFSSGPARNSTLLTRCTKMVPGTDVNAFLDQHHLNVAGQIYAWPHLCEWINATVAA